MKRLCYVIPSLDVGGAERQLTYLARGLAEDHEVTIVCTQQEGALVSQVREAGVAIRVLDGWNRFGGWDPQIRSKLRRLFRQHRPDILHTFLFGFDLPANRAARETGVPVVISSRRQLADWKRPRHIRLQRKANDLVDCIVANSQAAADYALRQEGGPSSRIRVIPNGIHAEAFASGAGPASLRSRFNLPNVPHVIGVVANFTPVKDHALFVEIARELLRRRTDVHFLMVGNGPLRKPVDRTLKQLRISEHFTRLDTVEDMPALYSLMAVSVLCSHSEGLPNAVMESMAAGAPVVASAVGGIPELIQDGETGVLVDSRDPKVYADVIAGLLDDPHRRGAISRAGREHIQEHHSVDRMVASYRELYNELLVRSAGAGA